MYEITANLYENYLIMQCIFQVMPGFLGWLMWDVGYPSILSAFSLIQLAFSQLTQVSIYYHIFYYLLSN